MPAGDKFLSFPEKYFAIIFEGYLALGPSFQLSGMGSLQQPSLDEDRSHMPKMVGHKGQKEPTAPLAFGATVLST